MLKKALNHFADKDPVMYSALNEVRLKDWWHQTPDHTPNYYFSRLTRTIIGQQLSGKAAKTIYGRFANLFADALPTPEQILKTEHETLRSAGLSNSKARYVRALAQAVEDGKLELAKLNSLSEKELRQQLTAVKGIGDWTVDMFMMFTLQRPDVFSFGDLGLKKGVEKLYQIKNPSKEQLLKISQKWKPYRSFASFALWHSLDNGTPE